MNGSYPQQEEPEMTAEIPTSIILPTHILPNNNPIVLLEHINLNVGTTFTPELMTLFFEILGCRMDSRANGVLKQMQGSGSKATLLRWANLGFQQFHLVCCEDPKAYAHLDVPWSNEQAIHGVIGLEWPMGEDAWEVLRLRLEDGIINHVIEHFEEIVVEEEEGETETTRRLFRVKACHGNIFQIEAQKAIIPEIEIEHEQYFIGPICPPPLVRNNPFPLPTHHPDGYKNNNNEDSPCVLGIRFVDYYVPHCHEALGGGEEEEDRSPLDVIFDTYNTIFPGLIHSRRGTSCESSSSRDRLELIIGHKSNAQYIRFTQLSAQDIDKSYDGHHLAIYVNDFEGAYKRAKGNNMVWENPVFPQFWYTTLQDALHFNEFRIRDFKDETTNVVVFRLEHEVRSLRHGGFAINKHVWADQAGGGDEATTHL